MPQDPRITKPRPSSYVSAKAITAGVSTTDATTGASTGASWQGLVAGATYALFAFGTYTAGAGTTGLQMALVRSGGLTLTASEMSVMAGNSVAALEDTITSSTTDGFSAGANSGGSTARSFRVDAVVVVNASGNLTLQFKTEVGGSAVTIVRGYATLQRIS